MVSTILCQKLNSSVFHPMSIPRGDFFALEVQESLEYVLLPSGEGGRRPDEGWLDVI
jgi:hypothetical protein